MDAPKIKTVIKIPMPAAPKPKFCDKSTKLLIKPRLIRPYENI